MPNEPVTLTSNAIMHSVLHGRLMAVRWRAAATAPALNALMGEVLRATREVNDLLYVGISSDEIGMPDAEVQRAATKNTLAMLPHVAEFNLVLEGTSIKAAMSRTFFRGMVTAARLGQRVAGLDMGGAPIHKIAIFDAIHVFAQKTGPRLGLAPPALLEQLERDGLMRQSGAPPHS